MAQVLALLRGLPMLETLILDQSLPAHDDDTNPTSPRHFLPNLHILTFGGRLESCSNVLKHITYPITTIATFNCDPSRESLPFTHFLQTAHSAIKCERDDHIIHSLHFKETSRRFVMKFWVVRRSSTPLPRQDPQLSVSMRRNYDRQIPFTEFVHSAVAARSLVEVRALCLSMLWSQINWSGFFQHLPKISALHLGGDFPSGLIEFLSRNENENPRPRPLSLVHLRGLWLTGTDFSRGSLQSLLACLQSRAQVGLAIQEIHLKDCWYLWEKDVERMKGLVHDVDWDEVEQEQEEYRECSRDFEGIPDSD